MIIPRIALLGACLLGLGLGTGQAVPELVQTIDHVVGADLSDSRRLGSDATKGDVLVLGYDDAGPRLKRVERVNGAAADLPTGDVGYTDVTYVDVAIDPAAGRYYVIGTEAVAGFAYGSNTPLFTTALNLKPGGIPQQAAINTKTKRLYITISGAGTGTEAEMAGLVKVIDLNGGKVLATVSNRIEGPSAIAVNETTNKIYVTNAGSPTSASQSAIVSVINGLNNAVTAITIPVPYSMGAEEATRRVAVNATTNKIYVALTRVSLEDGTEFNAVEVINGSTDRVEKEIDLLAGDEPRHARILVADKTANKVYMATYEDYDAVAVIDGATGTVGGTLDLPSEGEIRDLAMDDTAQELQVLVGDEIARVRTAAAGADPVALQLLDSSPEETAVNPVTGKIYAMDITHHVVFVLSEATGKTLKVIPIKAQDPATTDNPYGIAVNTETNRVYVVSQNNDVANGGRLHVIDGETDAEIKAFPLWVRFADDPEQPGEVMHVTLSPHEVIVDAPRHRLFVRQSGYVTVVDTATDTVDETAIETLPEISGIRARIAYNPVTDRLYALAYNDEGQVVIGVYDPTSKQQVSVIGGTAELEAVTLGLSDLAVNTVTDRVYVVGGIELRGEDHYGLFVFDGTTGEQKAAIPMPAVGDTEPSLSGARLAVNTTRGRVYATAEDPEGAKRYLVGINPEASIVSFLGTGGTQPSMVFVNDSQRLYLTTVNHGGVGDSDNGETRIFDDSPQPGVLSFSASRYNGTEASGASVTVTVKRTGGNAGAVSVPYGTAAGTALPGEDYTETSGSLTWLEGDSADKTFTVPLVDDAEVEGQETIALALGAPSGGATLGATAQATVVITSNDVASPNAPKITSVLSATGEVNRAFTYAVRATKVPKSYAATGLPAGLKLNVKTGLINGTPAVNGVFNVVLKATNAFGSGFATLILSVGVETKADLMGTFTNLTVTKTASGGWTIKGVANVSNIGTRGAPAFKVMSYISPDQTLETAMDVTVGKVGTVTGVPAIFRGTPIASLAKQKSVGAKAVRIDVPAAKVSLVSGHYLLISVDVGNKVPELNEDNNLVIVGPLQLPPPVNAQ